MKNSTFLAVLFLNFINFSQPLFSQSDNNIWMNQALLANVNPVQHSRNINNIQIQGRKQGFELENQSVQVNDVPVQLQTLNNEGHNNEGHNFNRQEEGMGNIKVLSGVRLPDISFETNKGVGTVKGFSKSRNKENPLDKFAYRLNKKIKKSFRKKNRGRNKSLNGCFAW